MYLYATERKRLVEVVDNSLQPNSLEWFESLLTLAPGIGQHPLQSRQKVIVDEVVLDDADPFVEDMHQEH